MEKIGLNFERFIVQRSELTESDSKFPVAKYKDRDVRIWRYGKTECVVSLITPDPNDCIEIKESKP